MSASSLSCNKINGKNIYISCVVGQKPQKWINVVL